MDSYIRSNMRNEGLIMKTRCSTQASWHNRSISELMSTTMGLAIVIFRSFSSSYGANSRHRVAIRHRPLSQTQSSKFDIAEASLPSARPNSRLVFRQQSLLTESFEGSRRTVIADTKLLLYVGQCKCPQGITASCRSVKCTKAPLDQKTCRTPLTRVPPTQIPGTCRKFSIPPLPSLHPQRWLTCILNLTQVSVL